MHFTEFSLDSMGKRMRFGGICSLLVVLVLVIGACSPGQPTEAEPEPAATQPPAAEPAEPEPAATEPPEEEPAEAEPTATAEPEEEPAEAEATAEPEEEPAEPEATSTPEAEEEPAEADPAATAEPEEEPVALGDADHGQYIMTLAGCGCHFNRDEGALAGGNRFQNPFGVAFAANITPDEETGIGNWSEAEIADALRLGVRPDGTQLVPVMPYARFSVLSDEEAFAVATNLLSLEPVANDVPERELTDEPPTFTPADEPPAEPPTDPADRGEQLVTVTNCSGCHTPYDADGAPDMSRYLAGAPLQDDEISANITPHDGTGIGTWSEAEIADYLRTGIRPDGSLASGSMADEIDRRFSILTEEDALAIAAYLKSVPAVDYDPYQ